MLSRELLSQFNNTFSDEETSPSPHNNFLNRSVTLNHLPTHFETKEKALRTYNALAFEFKFLFWNNLIINSPKTGDVVGFELECERLGCPVRAIFYWNKEANCFVR